MLRIILMTTRLLAAKPEFGLLLTLGAITTNMMPSRKDPFIIIQFYKKNNSEIKVRVK